MRRVGAQVPVPVAQAGAAAQVDLPALPGAGEYLPFPPPAELSGRRRQGGATDAAPADRPNACGRTLRTATAEPSSRKRQMETPSTSTSRLLSGPRPAVRPASTRRPAISDRTRRVRASARSRRPAGRAEPVRSDPSPSQCGRSDRRSGGSCSSRCRDGRATRCPVAALEAPRQGWGIRAATRVGSRTGWMSTSETPGTALPLPALARAPRASVRTPSPPPAEPAARRG